MKAAKRKNWAALNHLLIRQLMLRVTNKLIVRLMEAEVKQELSNRISPAFKDPTDKGLDKMYTWIQDTMSKSAVRDDLEVGKPETVVNLEL